MRPNPVAPFPGHVSVSLRCNKLSSAPPPSYLPPHGFPIEVSHWGQAGNGLPTKVIEKPILALPLGVGGWLLLSLQSTSSEPRLRNTTSTSDLVEGMSTAVFYTHVMSWITVHLTKNAPL